MRLSPLFNGAQSTRALVQPVLDAAGSNTSVGMNTAQSWADAELLALLRSASAKS